MNQLILCVSAASLLAASCFAQAQSSSISTLVSQHKTFMKELPSPASGRRAGDEGGRAHANYVYFTHFKHQNDVESAFRQAEPPSSQASPACGRRSLIPRSNCLDTHTKNPDDNPPQRVLVQGQQTTTLPTIIPTTIEGIDAKTLARTVNAIDAEDALKYFPSLLVRKRFVGDFNHAVLATRASGTGNSARSLVYADGILISNLLGNGASFTPRWGMIAPEEIARVDVLYGPFSAAYAGNSVGAVVDYVTRMPEQFQAHIKFTGVSEQFKLAATDRRYSGNQFAASLGDKQGNLSWRITLNRLHSNAHPIAFVNKLASTGLTSNAGIAVTGAVAGKNPQGKDWWLVGSSGQTETEQDHAKIKLAYDLTSHLRATYTLVEWHNDANSKAQSYLHDANGQTIDHGDINIAGQKYTLGASDFAPNQTKSEHRSQAVHLKSHHNPVFDWAFIASRYDYVQDQTHMPSTIDVSHSGAGHIADGQGTGWNTLTLKGIWRPNHQHIAEFGLQNEAYHLRTQVNATRDWIAGKAEQAISAFQGDTKLISLYLQDAWHFQTDWKAIIGARLERWQAHKGAISNATTTLPFASRNSNTVSPKAALSYQWSDELSFKASSGNAVRMPTVSELYQGSISTQSIVNSDPHLKPERSWTHELSAELSLINLVKGKAQLRSTTFFEDNHDALYAQTNAQVTPAVTTIQNVEHIRTQGLEIAVQSQDVFASGLDLSASLTYAHSLIVRNSRLPNSEGKWQPRVPNWRANLVASYRANERLSSTFGLRYSGRQFGTLDNSDITPNTYTGVSRFLVADLRVRYQIDRQWSAALGIDNLNNQTYWAFHPYAQRSIVAELNWSH